MEEPANARDVQDSPVTDTCKYLHGDLEQLLQREWLITNGLGGYASSTVVGCPTRRYHGTLVWSRTPPLQRYVMLATTLERLIIDDGATELATFEFNGAIHPQGYKHLVEFDFEIAPPEPWAQFVWQVGAVRIVKRIQLFAGQPYGRITYEIYPDGQRNCAFAVMPLLACRDFHHLRRKPAVGPFELQEMTNAVYVRDQVDPQVTLCLAATGSSASQVEFRPEPDWWYNFLYRKEAERRLDCGEDLFTPGWFRMAGGGPLRLQITLVPGCKDITDGVRQAWRAQPAKRTESWRLAGSAEIKALWRAADQFVVQRHWPTGKSTLTILAGYPWFGDWGRDTCIALPGLLLSTARYEEAREVLCTFAEAQQNGLIPNRFDDYGRGCDYNSVDASLWFIRAVERLFVATNDPSIWRGKLGKAVAQVIEAFIEGTDFDIRVEPDGLLWCGNAETQLTWMDAKFQGRAITPRYGKAVEINALWLHALHVAAQNSAGRNERAAKTWEKLGQQGRERFGQAFWYEEGGYLYDVVRDDQAESKLRPNQVIALSLPDCPLALDRQERALRAVQERLLTPYGLRTLAPDDPDYHGRYAGDWRSRDEAYHQGTVWAWLIGPFIEAYLRINEFRPEAKRQARTWLQPLIDHMCNDAGLGSISEIFDGDPPHTPRGCIAQAWSVAEVLRALLMVQDRPAPRQRKSLLAQT